MAKRKHFPGLPFGNTFLLSTSPAEVLSILNGDEASLLRRVESSFAFAEANTVRLLAQAGAGLSAQLRAVQATVNYKHHLAVANTLKRQFREIADSWMDCGKQLDAPGTKALYEKVEKFLASHPLILFSGPLVPPSLCFPDGTLRGMRHEIDRQLGWMSLCLVASTWSGDLYRCPRCTKFFVRKRAGQAVKPRCSRKCRRASVESEKKGHQRASKHLRMVKAAREGISELAKLPTGKRPVNWEAVVAEKVLRRLRLPKPITQRSITRWWHNDEIQSPSESSGH